MKIEKYLNEGNLNEADAKGNINIACSYFKDSANAFLLDDKKKAKKLFKKAMGWLDKASKQMSI
jgi:hypothetical protein